MIIEIDTNELIRLEGDMHTFIDDFFVNQGGYFLNHTDLVNSLTRLLMRLVETALDELDSQP